MQEKFYGFDPSVRLANRVELLKDWLLKELAQFAKQERKEPWVDEQIQLLDPDEYQKAYTRVRRKQGAKSETFDDFDRERSLLAKMVVNEWLKPVRKWIKRMRFVDVKAMYQELCQNRDLFMSISADGKPRKNMRKSAGRRSGR